jgi:pimeloyl-ACP methyl ester carboxylesterase
MNWLLLRGLAREQRHWGDFPDILRARLAGDVVHALDLPGAGTEHARRSPGSIAAITRDVRGRWLLLRERHEGPWSVVAASLGGMVAMEWCRSAPSDFERAVLINSSAGNLSPPWQRLDLRAAPGVLRTLLSTAPVKRQRRILQMTTRLRTDLDSLAEQYARWQREAPMARANVVRQILAGALFRAPPRLAVPALVLSGARDPFTDPRCPRRVAEHLGAQLRVHPDAGHDLPLDAPEWVADRIVEWARASAHAGARAS